MKRDVAVDITKGIAIILMMLGHCKQIPHLLEHSIYSFHMPLFFIASGYCFKPKGLRENISKDFRRLLVPYIVCCIVILLFYGYIGIKEGNCSKLLSRLLACIIGNGTLHHKCLLLADFPTIGPIWFLPALFICKNVYNTITKNKIGLSIILFVGATILGRYVVFIPFSFLSAISAVLFFAIGDYLKQVQKIEWYWFTLGLICWIVSLKYSSVNMAVPRYNLYLIDVIGATAASVFVYIISKRLSKIKVVSQTLSWLGRNTLLILCIHAIDLNCGFSSRINILDNDYINICITLIFPVIGTILFNFIKRIIEPNKNMI